MNESASRLIVRRGQSLQSEYALSEQAAIIGREAINDIMLQDLEISRRHASITFVNGRHVIEDLNSTNGTFVNGRRISTPIALRDGDVIDLGDNVSLVYHGPEDVAEATLVDPDLGQVKEAATREVSEAEPGPYSPPPDVPQFSPQQSQPDEVPSLEFGQPPGSQIEPAPGAPGPPVEPKRNRRMIYAGCGCLILIVIIGCIGSFVFLDYYQEGDLLYCQSLRPIWEALFGEGRLLAICQ
jgi:pilus assembly protein CpaF